MKKGLIAAGLLVSLSGTAQDVSTYTPGTMGEGVVYYLPKTEIELQVTATKVVYTPGEFCQYADRYLRLTGISSQPEEHWEINSIKVNSIGIPDPDNAYAVKLKDKSAASQVELTPEGIIKAINTTSPIEKAPVAKVTNLGHTIDELKEQGMWFVCADMGGETMYNLNLTGPIGVVIGNEGEGVSRLIREKCDFVASIPMKGDIDSLNASVAAGVLGYEIVRQRLQKK